MLIANTQHALRETMPFRENDNPSMNELLTLFRDKEIDTRWRAAREMSTFGPKAVEPLLMQLYDKDRDVRILSVWALGRIGDERAIEPISRSLNDENALIQMACEGALSRLTRSR
jgi:HEAT repeat protein